MDKNQLIEYIKEQVRLNNKIIRQAIAQSAGVSIKTVQRSMREIENLHFVGFGKNGHWELKE